MKLPNRLLETLRGPIVAVAMAGCTAPIAMAELAPEPIPDPIGAPVELAATIDPVAYDSASESERYDRLDQARASEDNRRDERIGAVAARNRSSARSIQISPALLQQLQQQHYYGGLVQCGRG